MQPMTIVEKILSRKAGRPLYAGDFATVAVDALMIHDGNAPLVADAFEEFDKDQVFAGTDVVMAIDHFVPCPTEAAANMHLKARKFASRYGLRLYEAGSGVGHQLMCEQGHVFPGEIAIGTDSHSCTYGALNALGTGVGATEAAGVLAYRKMWFRVPETIKVVWHGSLKPGVTAKDVILKTIETIGLRSGIYKTIEFAGELVNQLSIGDRLTMCNMGVEVGAKAALMPADSMLLEWLKGRTNQRAFEPSNADPGASYSRIIELDADILEPLIACPPQVNTAVPARQLTGKRVHQVIIGSCTNGRIEDFQAAAALMAGRPVASGVRMVLCPASKQVLTQLMADGTIEKLVQAGGILLPPGCGPCGGFHGGLVGRQEVVLATTSRNFTGRMGSQDSEIYLSSPLAAAAAAVTGVICDPREVMNHGA